MSRENVEAITRMIDAFNERSVEGMMAECDPGVEFKPVLAGVTDIPYRGKAGVRNFLAATDESFEHFELQCERIEDHGDYVLAVNQAYARGRASGAEIRRPIVQIAEVREGRCVWFQSFLTPAEALEAMRLRE